MQINATDRKILSVLQRDGRISVTDLAEQAGLSLSGCHRRLRALEDSQAIQGYRTQLDPKALGLGFSALVFISMENTDRSSIHLFEQTVSNVDEIIEAKRLFGDPDYLLTVMTKDLDAFQKLYDRVLSDLPGVRRLTSTLVMKEVCQNKPLPF